MGKTMNQLAMGMAMERWQREGLPLAPVRAREGLQIRQEELPRQREELGLEGVFPSVSATRIRGPATIQICRGSLKEATSTQVR